MIYKYEEIRLVEFVFNNLLNELEVLEAGHELVTSRLRLVKKIVGGLVGWHDEVVYKAAFIVTKVYFILSII